MLSDGLGARLGTWRMRSSFRVSHRSVSSTGLRRPFVLRGHQGATMRRTFSSLTLLSTLVLGLIGTAHAGPYAPAAGKPGTTAIGKDLSLIHI